jgi:ABC-type phosphate transport system auxiliary subunit
MDDSSFDKKGTFKAMLFAVLICLAGLAILGWQYHQIENKRIPLIEEEIGKQKEEIQQRAARNLLDKFMLARLEKNEAQASLYLTEGAMEQKLRGEFGLLEDFESYEVLNAERLQQDKYRFTVKLYNQRGDFIEAITLIKILDRYYVEAVQLAG